MIVPASELSARLAANLSRPGPLAKEQVPTISNTSLLHSLLLQLRPIMVTMFTNCLLSRRWTRGDAMLVRPNGAGDPEKGLDGGRMVTGSGKIRACRGLSSQSSARLPSCASWPADPAGWV